MISRRYFLSGLGTFFLSGCATSIDRSFVPIKEHAISNLTLEEKARKYEDELFSRFVSNEGVVVYRKLKDDKDKELRQVPDQAFHTGLALAAESFNAYVTQNKQSVERSKKLLDGIKLLGDVTGNPGFYARCITTLKDRHLRKAANNLPYRWWGDRNNGQLASIVFGLTVAYYDNPNLREYVKEEICEIAEHLIRNGFSTKDDSKIRGGNLEAWYGPIPIGVNALLTLSIFKLAYEISGEKKFRKTYEELICKGYSIVSAFGSMNLSGRFRIRGNDQAALVSAYSLLRSENNSFTGWCALRTIKELYQDCGDEENALLELTASSFDIERERVTKNAIRTLKEFPERKVVHKIDLTDKIKVKRIIRGRHNRPRALRPLPIHQRTMGSYMWFKDPYELRGGEDYNDGELEYAGVDYLLAYWLGRRHGLIEKGI